MVGHSIEVERVIAASVDRVWHVLTDLEDAPGVIRSIEAVERIAGEGWDVGVRWRETRRLWGRSETEEMWVDAVEPSRSTTVKAVSRGTEYTTVFRVAEAVGGDQPATRVTVTFSAETESPGPAQRIGWVLFGKAGMRATAKALEADLEDIAHATEAPPED